MDGKQILGFGKFVLRDCPSYPGYSITKDGHVFTHRHRFGLGKGMGGGVKIDKKFTKEMNPYIGHGGYIYVAISTIKGQRSIPIHTLLLDAFVGLCPKNMEVRHLDGNPQNNSLDNLLYGTVKENAEDRKKHGHNRRGSNHPRSKLSETIVIDLRKRNQMGESIASLSREFNVSESTMSNAIKGKTWKYI
ncbi:MAG: HNH endonuclease [Candidatus Moranbacteria bacterium]|nr:HNH endonuclease [Candidatus Moranbacteria bacterium]